MILRTLLTAALFTATAHAASDFDRTLTVSGQPDLYVSTGSGRVHIYPGSGNEIHVKAHVYAGWNAGGDIENRIRQIAQNPPVRQSGNEIHLGDVSPQDRHLYNNITIDYEISAPRSVALNLHTGSGDIEVDNLGRFLKAETGSGDIELQQQSAGQVTASTGSGSIRINGLDGPLNARTGSGDIEANGAITGPSKLQSGSGSIRAHVAHDTHLNVEASTGSGTIRVAGNSTSDHHHVNTALNGGGPTLEAHTGSGDIEIN